MSIDDWRTKVFAKINLILIAEDSEKIYYKLEKTVFGPFIEEFTTDLLSISKTAWRKKE